MASRALEGIYFQEDWWSSEQLMQTVSATDLRDRPFESLFYLHIQPPMMDTLRATLAQIFHTDDDEKLIVNIDRGLDVVE